MRAIFTISVYFIVEFIKALGKSLELRICHTSGDIADSDVPGKGMVVPSEMYHILKFFIFAFIRSILEKGYISVEKLLEYPGNLDLSGL